MRLCMVVGVCGLCAAASAQVERFIPVPNRATVAPVAINGKPWTTRPASEAVVDLYTNNSGAYFSSTAVPRASLDGITMDSGGSPVDMHSVVISFVTEATFPIGGSCDVRVLFFEDCDETNLLTPINANVLGDFTASFVGLDPGFIYSSFPIDLNLVFGQPVTVADGHMGLEFRVIDPATQLPHTTCTIGFAGGPIILGSSVDLYWRDANLNGVYDPSDARFFGGAPNLANFYFEVDGEVVGGQCYADCEGDGDLDVFDFLCFQNEHSNQTAYGDCENDGDWDIFDFLCFQNAYSNGCP